MKFLVFKKINIGLKRQFDTKITEKDINKFSLLSGDTNLIHLNKEYAKKKKFKNRVIHGAHVLSLFSKLIGNKLPGNNALIIFLEVKFKNPAYPNKIISISGRVKEKYKSVNSIVIELLAKYKTGKVIANGLVTVKIL